MEQAVVIQKLSVRLGKTFTALSDVSAVLPAGKIIGIIGPSGAGKTTLIRSIVGRQKVTSGSITIFDQAAGSPELRSQVSYLPQELSVYADLTVQENLQYFTRMIGIARGRQRETVAQLLKAVDLEEHAGSLVGQLSGGQKRRVSLAIALLGAPRLLVLDEPTVGLDPVLREQLWQLFNQLADGGATLIITSHVMDEASRCHDLLLLRDGRVLAHGAPVDLCQQTNSNSVEESFIKLVSDTSERKAVKQNERT